MRAHVVGEQLTFNVDIVGGKDVVGYQLTVQFDATFLRFVSSANGDYLLRDACFVSPSVRANSVSLAASSLTGKENTADVNGDGVVNILDRVTVAGTIELSADAASVRCHVRGDMRRVQFASACRRAFQART